MTWSSVGSFFINSTDWVFGSTNLDIDGNLTIKLEYEQVADNLDVYGLIADVYFDASLSFSKPLFAQVKAFYPRPKTSDLIIFSPPGRFEDPGEGVDLPGGFIWEFDGTTNQYVLRADVWRRVAFRRAFKRKGFKHKTLRDDKGVYLGESFPWQYGNKNINFRVFTQVYT